jgi:putative heme-binding domain-containing protein
MITMLKHLTRKQLIKTMTRAGTRVTAVLFCAACMSTCRTAVKSGAAKIDDVAGNKDVAAFMNSFEGRGALSDSSVATSPQTALAMFKYPEDLTLELVLAEPSITQPLHISFDHRGRLWVVQYNQYPYPKGLKVVAMDEWLRAKYNDLPKPPPTGVKGADKVTVFEDTDGDGRYDKSTDAFTGLNMATSIALGRGRIWILDPPYLLAYPDQNNDGLADGPPVVHLSGFGLEDTHAVANSLRWGPDGWLYGAQGSTCTADVSSAVTKSVKFNGQAIWRYHPETKVFEIFAEGGGNTFYIEIDEKGRFFSGHNGNERGQYYKQGGYYIKNVDKHGAVTNPYAFGFLPNMKLTGDKLRFTHAFIKYQGASLPVRFNGQMIAINPLQNYVQLSSFDNNGSTFSNTDSERMLQTKDHWFRPVDIKAGPDGAIYLADWYDSRLSHIDPRDTWHKGSGRIYRLKNKSGHRKITAFDLSTYTNDQLIGLLSHENKWFRQQALRQFGDRKDRSVVEKLLPLLKTAEPQTALEALWAIHLSAGFNDEVALIALQHRDPFVRMWAIRLAGDDGQVRPRVLSTLVEVAGGEPHAEVRSQLAATCKRLPPDVAAAILKQLITHHNDASDPDIPLQVWWAVESKAESGREAMLSMFKDKQLWNHKMIAGSMVKKLMQRYVMAGGNDNMSSAARLVRLAPSAAHARILIDGLTESLRGRETVALPADLLAAIKPHQAALRRELLGISLRQGDKKSLQEALVIVNDAGADEEERMELLNVLGEINNPAAVPVLLDVAENTAFKIRIREAALLALQAYDNTTIGTRLINSYPTKFRNNPVLRTATLNLFAVRAAWARPFLELVESSAAIQKTDVDIQLARRFMSLNDGNVRLLTRRLWPEVKGASSADKNKRIQSVVSVLKSGRGDATRGRGIYINTCGSCHRLFNEGGTIGPDLTGYDRKNVDDLLINIVDPNAYIREGYVMTNITTTDGRTLMGTVKSRNGKTVTLQTLSGEQVVLASDNITGMKELSSSLMPERLIDGLSAQETRDFFAYLMKQQEKP